MSIEIKKKIKLSDYSTFKIGGEADYFTIVKSEEDLQYAISWANKKNKKVLVLGWGSNIVFSDQGFSGLIIKNEIKGIEIVGENEDNVVIKAYSGEIWSKLVNFTVDNNFYGLENTFYIPGTVGAAPIQNIGAYGVEIKDFFYNLCAIDLKTGEKRFFNLKDCRFNYRDSIFKNELKGKYFILWIDFKLLKYKKLILDYPDIQLVLKERNIISPSNKELINIIKEIRDKKLPNPAILPNAGSFFKNPIINIDTFNGLKDSFPDLKYFIHNDRIKIPAGWLIEKCGLKGKRFGSVGVYDKQALILVNYGGAKQKDILELIKIIKNQVKIKFDIELEPEVNIL